MIRAIIIYLIFNFFAYTIAKLYAVDILGAVVLGSIFGTVATGIINILDKDNIT